MTVIRIIRSNNYTVKTLLYLCENEQIYSLSMEVSEKIEPGRCHAGVMQMTEKIDTVL
jgi:hypothetical protein